MPSERIAMRQVLDVIRLKSAGLAVREIARRIGVAPSTVRLTLERLAAAGLNWPLADDLTDGALEAQLFANAGTKQGHRRSQEPDWAEGHRASPMRRRPGRKGLPIGSARMPALSRRSVECRSLWSPTTPRPR